MALEAASVVVASEAASVAVAVSEAAAASEADKFISKWRRTIPHAAFSNH